MTLQPNIQAPAFTLPDHNGKEHSLQDFSGEWVVLYFYPKDMTPGCTKEACGFRDLHGDLKREGANIIGISTDSIESHQEFKEKHELPFLLLSDEDAEVTQAYDAGKRRAKRVSYLIDPNGEIAKVYDKVKPKKHAEQILKDLETLKEA
jgi:peroxiredoxin Q/BCP